MEVSAEDLKLMRLMDELHLRLPFYGSRRLAWSLQQKGYAAGRKRVQRLMRQMGITTIYPRPRTSEPHPDHRIYPYLLRDYVVSAADQVWSADITYVPMQHGFMYLVAILDWHSRYVLAWRLSNTLDSDFCVEALRAALRRGRPAIFNTDQGSQFTSQAFTGVLEREVRKRVCDGLRDGGGVEGGFDALLRLLLSPPAPSVVRQPISLGSALGRSAPTKTTKSSALKLWPPARLKLESLLTPDNLLAA